MLNNNQEVNQTTIDERVLPTSGLILAVGLLKFTDEKMWISDEILIDLVKECEKNNIFIFRTTPNPRTWLVCLDDFREASKNVTK